MSGITDMWRSKDMVLMSLITTRDQSHDVGAALVNLELCQFIDTQPGVPAFNREFSPELANICEIEQRLLILRDAIEKHTGVPIPNQEPCMSTPTIVDISDRIDRLIATYRALNNDHRQHIDGRNRLCELIAVLKVANEVLSDARNGYVPEVNDYYKSSIANENEDKLANITEIPLPSKREVKYGGNSDDSVGVDITSVKTDDIHTTVANIDPENSEELKMKNEHEILSPQPVDIGENSLIPLPGIGTASGLNSIIGTIPTKSAQLLFRLIFRATKGNCVIKFDESGALSKEMLFVSNRPNENAVLEPGKKLSEIEDNSKEIVTIFVIGNVAKQRCKQLIESVSGTVFQVPNDAESRERLIHEAIQRRNELEVVIRQSTIGIIRHLTDAAKYIDGWCLAITKEKMIYHVLNMFRRVKDNILSKDAPGTLPREDGESLFGIAWVPSEVTGKIKESIETYELSIHGGGRNTIIHFIDDKTSFTNENIDIADKKKKTENKQQLLRDNIENELNFFINDKKVCKTLMKSEVLKQPPTFFPTNKFTQVFQNICNSYGSANYHEINPSVFYMFIFPFTFAIMFGDIGHGVIILLVTLFMIAKEKSLANAKNDIISMLYTGRYLILMMAIMSIITGFIYNDTFSLHFNTFGSWIHWNDLFKPNKENVGINLDCSSSTSCTFDVNFDGEAYRDKNTRQVKVAYPFGIDPNWLLSDTSMLFTNSFKMKVSIVIGVSQMLFGLVMKLINTIYFSDWVELFTCWIPEFLMMASFFGYMVFCIIWKWMHYWGEDNIGHPPSLTNMFINMFLSTDPLTDSSPNAFYPDLELQDKVRWGIVVIFFISLVWLLITKPIVQGVQVSKKKKANAAKKASKAISIVQKTPKASHTKGVNNNNENGSLLYTGLINEENTNTLNGLNFGEKDNDSDELDASQEIITKYQDTQDEKLAPITEEEEDEELEGIGDIIVHQVIHTIEYTLGCISHTASYLRLWALSLAHAQLADVFYSQLVERFIDFGFPSMSETGNLVIAGILIGITYTAWFVLSIAVLCLMEALSAFLHALRLAWIEFNSKFFVAEGHSFSPMGIPKVIPIAESSKTVREELKQEL